MTDLRNLISRMADELDHYCQILADDRRATHALATEARAALTQPEPEVVGPTDEELRELYLATMLDADRDEDDFFAFARAVLARYSHQPAPAAAGEVGEADDND